MSSTIDSIEVTSLSSAFVYPLADPVRKPFIAYTVPLDVTYRPSNVSSSPYLKRYPSKSEPEALNACAQTTDPLLLPAIRYAQTAFSAAFNTICPVLSASENGASR